MLRSSTCGNGSWEGRTARTRIGPIGLAIALAAVACTRGSSSAAAPAAVVPAGAEGVSLLGVTLRAPVMPTGPVLAADSALGLAPSDPDRLLAAAGARATAWRFREAIDLYSRGIRQFPQDARFYRFRGHRYLTLRRFEDGQRDLDRAAQLDSTSFDVAYHQGLVAPTMKTS